jgi:hypothetical protein
MTRMTIAARLRDLETSQIVAIVRAAAARQDDDGDIVLDVGLAVLELRMPEAAFLALCEEFA